jgi:Flp pilus assembly pilin Flp
MHLINPKARLAGRTQQFGQGMTEYIIILVFVAIACVGAYSSFGTTVREQTAAVADGLAGINAPPVQAVPAATQQGNAASQAPAAPAIAAPSSGGSGQNASPAAAVPYIAALSSAGSGQNAAPQAVAQLAMVAPPLTQQPSGPNGSEQMFGGSAASQALSAGRVAQLLTQQSSGTSDPETPFDDPVCEGTGSGAGAACKEPGDPGDPDAGLSLLDELVGVVEIAGAGALYLLWQM